MWSSERAVEAVRTGALYRSLQAPNSGISAAAGHAKRYATSAEHSVSSILGGDRGGRYRPTWLGPAFRRWLPPSCSTPRPASTFAPVRLHACVLALFILMNYSASAQRPIVAFTTEYTWDIESKER